MTGATVPRMSTKYRLFLYLDEQPRITTLTGWGLFDAMYFRTGRKTTPATLLQYLREYADISGAAVECIERARSMYRLTKAGPWGVAGGM